MIITKGNSDLAFKHFTSALSLRDQPKLWYRYIQMFVSSKIKNISNHRINCKVFLFKLFDFSAQWLKSSTRKLFINNSISQNMTTPGPKFLYIMNYFYPCTGWSYTEEWKPFVSFAFKLHSFLRINLTFYAIYFYRFTGRDYVVIHNSTKLSYSCFITPSLCFMNGSVFSGYHSDFNYYPEFHKFLVDIVYNGHELFKIDVSFQVMDQGIIKNIVNYSNYLHNIFLMYEVQSKLKKLMEILFLGVRKTHQILLQFPQSLSQRFVIFDGPGFLAKTLHTTGESAQVIKTSSFQCIVQYLSKNFGNNLIYTFNYASKPLVICKMFHIYSIKDHLKTLPFAKCHESPVFIEIVTQKMYQINISVVDLSSKTKVFPDCTLGGLQISEQLSGEYRESVTLCRSESTHRNFYSHNSSARVLLYWYEPYDQIRTVLNISQTKCRHIHIDPCFGNRAYKDNTPYDVYLSHVTKYLNITLVKHGDGYFLKDIEEHCVIIQVFPLRYSCFLCEFKFSLLNDQYKIQDATMRRESPYFHGLIFRYREQNLAFCDNKHRKCLQKGSLLDFPRIFKENKHYRSLLIKKSFVNESFTMLIWLFDLRAINWMEITVGKSEKVQKSADRFAYDYNMISQRHIDVIFRNHYYHVVVLKLQPLRKFSISTSIDFYVKYIIPFPYIKTQTNLDYGKFLRFQYLC